jgi:hypothetical protein
MCVQFLKSCVQFLMDTILNLTIAQFLMKKNGDVLAVHASRILAKGDAPTKCMSHIFLKGDSHLIVDVYD